MAASQPTPAAAKATNAPAKSTLADWAATEEDEYNTYYEPEKRQRGGRKKRKKHQDGHVVMQNWDDIYDPSRPTIYEEYRHSEEKVREVREWKDRLYAHRMRRSSSSDSDDEDYDRPMNRVFTRESPCIARDENTDGILGQFAPPGSFAPPPNLNDVPPPPSNIPDDASGEDAFARRARIGQPPSGDTSTREPISASPPPPPPPEQPVPPANSSEAPLPPPTTSRPPHKFQPSSATISRAPVRYTLPPPPEDIPATEAELEAKFAQENSAEDNDTEDGARSKRPGQKHFAERILAKYGWTKGSGLGASGEGIVKPLQVKAVKPKKRPDSEGGGFATPAGRGTIIGGKRKGGEDTGKFGPMSEVIILKGMLDGMDLDEELGREGGGLMQEIGEECSEKVF